MSKTEFKVHYYLGPKTDKTKTLHISHTFFLSVNSILCRTDCNLSRYSFQWAVPRTAVQWGFTHERINSIHELIISAWFVNQIRYFIETRWKEGFVQFIQLSNSTHWIKDPIAMVLELPAHWRGRWLGSYLAVPHTKLSHGFWRLVT